MSAASWDYIAKLVCIGDSGCGKSSLTIRLCEGRFVAHHDVTIGVEFGSRIVPVGPPHASTTSSLPPADTTSTKPQDGADESSDSPSQTNAQPKPPGLPTPRTKSPPPIPQKHMKLSLWDTAGQETYKSVTRSYFRGASGALLVFDLSRRSTFLHVTDWLADLRQIAEPDIVVVLVGNKADLTSSGDTEGQTPEGEANKPDKRAVSKREATEWAQRNGVLEYVETSAKSGEGVEKAFMRVAERIHQNIQAGKYDLNDRRSGVKGPSVDHAARAIKLNDQVAKKTGGMCC